VDEDAKYEGRTVMSPWGLLALGAGGATGLGKTAYDMTQQNKEKKLQAETTRWSPWTNMKADAPRALDPVGDLMKGALSAAVIGKQMGAFKQAKPPGTQLSGTDEEYLDPDSISPWMNA
jgi:hypothetical protein